MPRMSFIAGLLLGLMAVHGPGAVQAMESAGQGVVLIPAAQTVDRCHKQCAPLLNLDSRSEAKRTYANCRSLCAGRGTVTCPDGSRVAVSEARRCGGPRSHRPRWRRYR